MFFSGTVVSIDWFAVLAALVVAMLGANAALRSKDRTLHGVFQWLSAVVAAVAGAYTGIMVTNIMYAASQETDRTWLGLSWVVASILGAFLFWLISFFLASRKEE